MDTVAYRYAKGGADMTTVMFWSPDAGHGKTSSHTAITAITAALQYRARLLLCHNGHRGHGVESACAEDLAEQAAEVWMDGPGIDRLHYLQQSGILNDHNVSDYMVPLIRGRLDMLSGTRYDEQSCSPTSSFWRALLTSAGQAYDLVLLDAGSGEDKLPLLKLADLVVVNLSQHMEQLHHFFSHSVYAKWAANCAWIPVLGAYRAESKLNQTHIARTFGLKRPLYTIRDCQPFHDAWNSRRLLSFMRYRLMLDWPEQQSGEFFRQSFELTTAVLEELERLEPTKKPPWGASGDRIGMQRLRYSDRMPQAVAYPYMNSVQT
ncbi:hypothetical protein [Paenibacillus campi]|uniref:hypothetical protein n=1 Tax=Paenibacillus campi TaxID=3106031 RepID=UPI002AFE96F4|nr:hypothetical protein [Paenibacillus sp. SGZ-1009]